MTVYSNYSSKMFALHVSAIRHLQVFRYIIKLCLSQYFCSDSRKVPMSRDSSVSKVTAYGIRELGSIHGSGSVFLFAMT
jgi:hypothetical protein